MQRRMGEFEVDMYSYARLRGGVPLMTQTNLLASQTCDEVMVPWPKWPKREERNFNARIPCRYNFKKYSFIAVSARLTDTTNASG